MFGININLNEGIGKYLPVLIIALMAALFVGISAVTADGNGSPEECKSTNSNVIKSAENPGDVVPMDVGAGNVADGVCIKSGENMFGGNQHSGVLGNGTYEDDCYTVTGVGTQTVTVERIGSGSDCQEISHIDVLFSKEGDTPPPNGETPPEEETPPEQEDDGEILGEEDQVREPVGAVSAGGGGGTSGSTISAVALVSSLAVAGFGAHKLRQLK